jgi:hypothetical protein
MLCEFMEWWELININVGIEVYHGENKSIERVLLVEQEQLTLPVHLCSPRTLVAFLLLGLYFSVLCFIIHCLPFFFFWSLYCLFLIVNGGTMRTLWANVVITTTRRGYNGYKPKVVAKKRII